MNDPFIKFNQVSYQYDTMAHPILNNISLHFRSGWTGIVGANGSGKTTLLKLALGNINPDSGSIETPKEGVYCEQRTDNIPSQFENFLESWDSDVYVLKGQLEIEADWKERWKSLSHGERKRAQIATVLWQNPEFLAIDEPTNHIDRNGRLQLIQSLEKYQGVGLMVSHDREVLETLCHGNIFLLNGAAVYQPGLYTEGKKQIEQDIKRQHNKWDQAYTELKKLKKRASGFRSQAAHANQKRSKKNISSKDHDAKSKIDAARITGRDALAGKAMNQLQGRISQTRKKIDNISIVKQYQTGVVQQGIPSHRKTILQFPEGTFSTVHQLKFQHPELMVQSKDKIAVVGNNGCGKSTLISYLINQVSNQQNQLVYLPQEISAEHSQHLLAEIKSLSNQQLGEIMTIIRRLGSNPAQILDSQLPSPGEFRKILIALGVLKKPSLMILDEPTNHLDLPSIECLETALKNFEAALIIVSHDQVFLDQSTDITWSMIRKKKKVIIEVLI
jgi:macrolide transport system ATP-binding/permease protein